MAKSNGELDFCGGQNVFPAFIAGNSYASNSIGVRPRSYGYNANNESAIMPQKENSLAL